MEGQNTRLVYEAYPASWATQTLAIVTLFALFFVTLCYMAIIPAALYYMFVHESYFMLAFLVLVFTSPFWANGTWHAVADSFIFQTWRMYFQFKVYKEEPLKQSRNILFTAFPHGIFPIAIPIMAGVCKQILPELAKPVPVAAIAENMFAAPIISPLLTWLGCVPAKEEYISRALQTETCILLPDGIAGAFHSDPDEEILYIRKRTGFVRIALQEGASLVPFYCFGHTQLFSKYPHAESWLANWSRRIRFSIIFFIGHTFLPPLPRRVPLVVVIGKAFPLAKVENPSEELVRETLDLYIQNVVDLFNRHKHRVPGWENKTLYIY